MSEDISILPSIFKDLNIYSINDVQIVNNIKDMHNISKKIIIQLFKNTNFNAVSININLILNNCEYDLSRLFDIYHNFKNNNKEYDNLVTCYIDNDKYSDNILNTDSVLAPFLLPFNKITLKSSNNLNITFDVLIVEHSIKTKLTNHMKTIPIGTILKRLQNPLVKLGKYFTYENDDISKCGVSKYYSNKGIECEKKIVYIKVIKEFNSTEYIARNTLDIWSNTTPEWCSGGAKIIKDIPTDSYEIIEKIVV